MRAGPAPGLAQRSGAIPAELFLRGSSSPFAQHLSTPLIGRFKAHVGFCHLHPRFHVQRGALPGRTFLVHAALNFGNPLPPAQVKTRQMQEGNPYLGVDCNDVGTNDMREQVGWLASGFGCMMLGCWFWMLDAWMHDA